MRFDSMGRLLRASLLSAAGLLALFLAGTAHSAGVTRQIHSVGTGVVNSVSPGSDAIANPEIDDAMMAIDAHDIGGDASGPVVNRSIAPGPGSGVSTQSGKAKSNPQLQLSFDAINFRQQRLANHGNQFSIEPPDQGLCVGNGFVLEVVNTVMRVFDANGNALTGVADLNTFYGYPAAINRATGARGPEITDPSCYYDADTQRWFLVVLTLDRVPGTNSLSGHNHLDIAVSTSASPLGNWIIYQIDVTGDGSDASGIGTGIPCDPNPTPGFGGFYVFACLGDYPHLGVDANGIYFSTNSFPFFFNGFNGAQLYAFSKKALASGAAVVTGEHFDTANYLLAGAAPGFPNGTPGFTVWPAISPPGSYATDQNGTEYLLSSQAVFNDSGADNRLRTWAFSNTASLNSAVPAVQLVDGVVNTQTYAVPPLSNQKAGDWPLGQCLNDPTCSPILGGPDPFAPEPFPMVDSNDSRMQQVSFANGKLWSALDTAVNMGGPDQAGIAYFVMIPQLSGSSISAKMVIQGTLGLQNNNLTYPAIAVLPNGRGAMAFTILGSDYYPSAGFASLDAHIGAGEIQVAAAGLGPDDGFTAYEFYNAPFPIRTRWGDYGAAVVDGNTIWIASEYINQTCTLAQYRSAPFGSCGGTRASLGNWSTRITHLNLQP